ncbi:MAG: succinate--CoA ligase subunit beta [Alphaproteobacteria bacterium]|nr:succinate--CoA ligase subunit beta [Alphaproteobacteria bacterium]
MDIHEYQAKNIFKTFGIKIPKGIIAYTPTEARDAALKISETGPWVVKAQIHAGSRDVGRFSDKRAGKKGGIRLSKTPTEVYENADKMLENMLVTNQTGVKGRLVSRVYVEEYIKTVKKFYVGLAVDWTSASIKLLISPVSEHTDDDIIEFALKNSEDILKLDLGLQEQITPQQLNEIAQFMEFSGALPTLKTFFNKIIKVFYAYDAVMLEINPIGISKDGDIWPLDAKIIFDSNALYRHKDVVRLADHTEIEEREQIAAKYGFQYKELDSGIGIISNGDGLALNIINEAKKINLNTACFLNLKGGVDRDKIAASIKLIMTNPKVDGIFINILGGFLRCNLIADGIITVANDLGLNIPLVVRFEGTNKEEATNILQASGLSLLIAPDTALGLNMLQKAIAEDL